MQINFLRLAGIRCFEDTGQITLSSQCNIFVGQNNVGKSTFLKGILAFQGFPFASDELRNGSGTSFLEILLEVRSGDQLRRRPSNFTSGQLRFVNVMRGDGPPGTGHTTIQAGDPFTNSRPHHTLLPFLAKRKAPQFTHEITSNVQAQISGTFSNLYSRIDLLATAGHPRHERFQRALADIVGLPITTHATPAGKEAGFYLDKDTFVPLERMGDGITEMVGLIVELSLEENKIFVLEEPETNLHPNGLKALLSMIRVSSRHNQFVISTHSNIVVRELAADANTKMFRVWRDKGDHNSSSSLEEIPRTPGAHTAVLRELGYAFSDFDLHEGWLFLEESSAESIFNRILIPGFVPALKGSLRTFSAGGATNIEPAVGEFQRLITFVHLEPIYRDRLWVRADGDNAGKDSVSALRARFTYLDEQSCNFFSQPDFELYYPGTFKDRIAQALQTPERLARRVAKEKLLFDVLRWTEEQGPDALGEWGISAAEPIAFLRTIAAKISQESRR